MKKLWRKVVSVILALAMVFLGLPEYVSPVKSAKADSADAAVHYIAVASDRHDNTSAISNAMGKMPSGVEYVCIAGDITTSAAWRSSTIVSEVKSVFSSLTSDTISIVGGNHDNDWNIPTDDAGILKCLKNDGSGLIYTGYESDGTTVAYYVYGISAYSMETSANTDYQAFMAWVDTVDPTIPVIVISHIPFHYASRRVDNPNGENWNNALNYAATGSTTGSGEIIRDVVFLHGHNHTSESNKEYYYAPGHTWTFTNSSKKSVSGKSQYTYITAGYLNANGNATLIAITDDGITFTKYDYDSRSGKTEITELGSVDRVAPKEDVYEFTAKNVSVRENEDGTVKPVSLKYSLTLNGKEITPTSVSYETNDPDEIIDKIEDGTVSFVTGKLGTATVTVNFEYDPNAGKKSVTVGEDGVVTGSAEVTLTVREYAEHNYSTIPQWEWVGDDENGYTAATAIFICEDEDCDETFDSEAEVVVTNNEPNCQIPSETFYTATAEGPDGQTYTAVKEVNHSHDIVVYVPVETLTFGKDYVIVDSNSEGAAHALRHNTSTHSVAASEVTIKAPDDEVDSLYIFGDDISADLVWTATQHTVSAASQYSRLINGGYAIFPNHYSNGGTSTNPILDLNNNLTTQQSGGQNTRYWVYEGAGKLSGHSVNATSTTYYMYYDNGFKANASGSGIYIFEKQSIKLGYGPHNWMFDGFEWGEGNATAYGHYTCSVCGATTTTPATVTFQDEDASCDRPYRTQYYAEITKEAAPDKEDRLDDSVYTPKQKPVTETVEDATVYVLADTVEIGKSYIIVNANTAQNGAHAVRLLTSGNRIGDASVNILSGPVNETDKLYILTDAADIVWVAGGSVSGNSLTFNNGDYYLRYRTGNNNYTLNAGTGTSYRGWTLGTNTLYYDGNRDHFLTFGDSWTTATTSYNVYFFEEVTGATIEKITYVDAPALGHLFEGDECHVEAKNATCTEDGNIEYWICDRCGKYFATDDTDPAAVALKDEDIVVKATGHIFESDDSHTEAVKATCTEDGNIEYWTCDVCGNKYDTATPGADDEALEDEDIVVKATGHIFESDDSHTEAVKATCTEDGNIEYWTCDVCGNKYDTATPGADDEALEDEDIVVKATGHVFETEGSHTERVEATCEADGNIEYWTCDACEERFDVEDAGVDAVPLTDEQIILHANGHVFETEDSHTESVDATCTTAGNIEYWTCDTCGARFATSTPGSEDKALTDEQIIIPATGHVFENEGSHVAGVAATCTTEGNNEYWICDVCAERFGTSNAGADAVALEDEDIIVKATGHVFENEGSHVAGVAATCTTEGNNEYWICDVCAERFGTSNAGADAVALEDEDIVIEALGHDWNEPEYEWLENDTKVKATRTCKNDTEHTHTESETVDVDYVEVPATTTTAGSKTWTSKEFVNEAFKQQFKSEDIPMIVDEIVFQTTINMADYTGIFVYIHIPDGEDASQYTVETTPHNTVLTTIGPKNKVLSKLPKKTRMIGEREALFYRIDATHLASDEMTDTVDVVLKKNGVVVKTATYSVESIAAERLASGTLDEVAVRLHKALVQYGYYAQIQFQHNLDNMPTLYPDAPALTEIPETYAPDGDPTDFSDYIAAFEAKVDCSEAVSINIYLTPADGYKRKDFNIYVTNADGTAYTTYTEPITTKGKIFLKIRDIDSGSMDKNFKIVVELKSNPEVTATWTRSVLTSAYEIYQTAVAAGKEETQNLVMSLYQYFLAAKEVFYGDR